MVLVVKNLPANAWDIRDMGLIEGDPLKKGMETHSSILTWRILWGRKELHTIEQLKHTQRKVYFAGHVNDRIRFILINFYL